MEPVTAAVLKWAGKKLASWWIKKKPLSKEARETRQFKRDQNKTLKDQGLSRKERKMKLLELLAQYSAAKRTSTKSGAAGLALPAVTMVLAAWPFWDQIKAFIANVCAQPDPADFLVAAAVGWAVTWGSMFVTARLAKTPPNPGKL